jgi:hypothetical protein
VEIAVMLVAILAVVVVEMVVAVVSNTNWNILNPSSQQRAKTTDVPSRLSCIL